MPGERDGTGRRKGGPLGWLAGLVNALTPPYNHAKGGGQDPDQPSPSHRRAPIARQNVSRILVIVDESGHSEQAFRWACQLARFHRAKLFALHVIEVPLALPLEAEIPEVFDLAENLLTRYELIARQEKVRGLEAGAARCRQAGRAIVQEVEDKGAGLVVIGIPYRRSMAAVPDLGAAAPYVLRHARCQVLFWRDIPPAFDPLTGGA